MADRLLDRLKPMMRTVHPIKWPGTDRDVGLLMLRCDELAAAELGARETIQKRGLGLDAIVNRDVLVREEEAEQVWRMVVEPDSRSGLEKHRIFKDVAEVKERLDPWERSYFVTWQMHYMEEQRKAMTWPDEEGED